MYNIKKMTLTVIFLLLIATTDCWKDLDAGIQTNQNTTTGTFSFPEKTKADTAANLQNLTTEFNRTPQTGAEGKKRDVLSTEGFSGLRLTRRRWEQGAGESRTKV